MASDLGNKKIMAQNIQYYLERKDINRKELSRILDVPYTTVCDWVKGRTYPRIDKIEMMANYFGVEKADLVENRLKRVRYYADNLRPELKELMEVARECSREDVLLAVDMLKRLRGE